MRVRVFPISPEMLPRELKRQGAHLLLPHQLDLQSGLWPHLHRTQDLALHEGHHHTTLRGGPRRTQAMSQRQGCRLGSVTLAPRPDLHTMVAGHPHPMKAREWPRWSLMAHHTMYQDRGIRTGQEASFSIHIRSRAQSAQVSHVWVLNINWRFQQATYGRLKLQSSSWCHRKSHTCHVILDISGSPIDFQWSFRKNWSLSIALFYDGQCVMMHKFAWLNWRLLQEEVATLMFYVLFLSVPWLMCGITCSKLHFSHRVCSVADGIDIPMRP